MMMHEHVIAMKNAKAFLNVFINDISLEDYKNLEILAHHLQDRRQVIAFLGLPNIDPAIKQKVLAAVVTKFSLPDCFNRLIQVLIKSRRVFLFPMILLAIAQLYRTRKNIEDFVIQSSGQLDNSELEVIKRFLSQTTGAHIISHHEIDKKLIAGIRLQSEHYVWEYSVAKKLRTLTVSHLEQEF